MENPAKKLKVENPELPCESAPSSSKHEEKKESLKQTLAAGKLEFSLKLYNELRSEKNVVFSPFSVRVALAMLAAGAAGTTLTQIKNALELKNEVGASPAFKLYIDSFSKKNKFVSTVNRIYLQKDFPIVPSFSQTLKTYYQSSVEHVDFHTDPSGTAASINEWVKRQTNNTIRNIVSSYSFSGSTALVLVNAIYFKGKWKFPFYVDCTTQRDFNLADGRIIQVPTMHSTKDLNITFSQALKSQVLQLPYKGDRFAMFIILPEQGTGLSTLQTTLNVKSFNDFMTNLSMAEVLLYLPKFKTSYQKELKVPLHTLGMKNVFEDSADLSKLSSDPRGVKLSSVFHQVFVAVDEEGTEAAAATEATLIPLCGPDPEAIEFSVDRPCCYLIYDLEFKQVLFMGNLDDPSSSS